MRVVPKLVFVRVGQVNVLPVQLYGLPTTCASGEDSSASVPSFTDRHWSLLWDTVKHVIRPLLRFRPHHGMCLVPDALPKAALFRRCGDDLAFTCEFAPRMLQYRVLKAGTLGVGSLGPVLEQRQETVESRGADAATTAPEAQGSHAAVDDGAHVVTAESFTYQGARLASHVLIIRLRDPSHRMPTATNAVVATEQVRGDSVDACGDTSTSTTVPVSSDKGPGVRCAAANARRRPRSRASANNHKPNQRPQQRRKERHQQTSLDKWQ